MQQYFNYCRYVIDKNNYVEFNRQFPNYNMFRKISIIMKHIFILPHYNYYLYYLLGLDSLKLFTNHFSLVSYTSSFLPPLSIVIGALH